MTMVRRPGRNTMPTPIPKVETNPPSRETVLKSEAAKRYLEEHFMKMTQQREMREERMQSLVESLEQTELTQEEKDQIIQEFTREESDYTRFQRSKIRPENYNFITLIGRGGFADVWLVTDKKTEQPYAMKIIRKSDVIVSDQITATRNERDILAIAHNPWIVQLQCSFQDDEHLYLILEFVQGGDLMNALIKVGTFVPKVARFFTAEIVLAVNSVHELGFIHSDLKPDNILIASTGHIKLTDFGIASAYGKSDADYDELLRETQDLMLDNDNPIVPSQTQRHHHRNSIIGTVDYIAPEVLRGDPPNVKNDWWSLGVILYEMLYGFTPFSSDSKNETVFRIINWKKSLRIPASKPVPVSALDLLRHLLCDIENRYGYEEIIHHAFFNGFDFENILQNKTPVKPVCSDPLDTAHFDHFDVTKLDLRANGLLTKLANYAFLGFTYKPKPQSATLAKLGFSFE